MAKLSDIKDKIEFRQKAKALDINLVGACDAQIATAKDIENNYNNIPTELKSELWRLLDSQWKTIDAMIKPYVKKDLPQ